MWTLRGDRREIANFLNGSLDVSAPRKHNLPGDSVSQDLGQTADDSGIHRIIFRVALRSEYRVRVFKFSEDLRKIEETKLTSLFIGLSHKFLPLGYCTVDPRYSLSCRAIAYRTLRSIIFLRL